MRKLLPMLALAALASACSNTETKTDAPVADASVKGAQPVAPVASTTRPATSSTVAGDPLHDPNSLLAQRSVYFDYDSNSVKDEFRRPIQAHASYMGDKRASKVRIEGNCDERGSREYNLALGQRRAESVKKMMTVLGVGDARIETVSYGEEKPAALGHDESSWAKNRRADIRYTTE
jgi:peptidoglycan-associated lipoprotein